MTIFRLFIWAVLFCAAGAVSAGDRFEALKADLGSAICVHIEFISIIDSDVFDIVDSMYGSAEIAQDGRFNVAIGDDRFLYDLEHLYSYSAAANQVVIEKARQDLFTGSEIAFVTRLDDFYDTRTIAADKTYRLTRSDDGESDIPDTITVTLVDGGTALEEFAFRDINDDLNTIRFLSSTIADSCRTADFRPEFPDSVERVRL